MSEIELYYTPEQKKAIKDPIVQIFQPSFSEEEAKVQKVKRLCQISGLVSGVTKVRTKGSWLPEPTELFRWLWQYNSLVHTEAILRELLPFLLL